MGLWEEACVQRARAHSHVSICTCLALRAQAFVYIQMSSRISTTAAKYCFVYTNPFCFLQNIAVCVTTFMMKWAGVPANLVCVCVCAGVPANLVGGCAR